MAVIHGDWRDNGTFGWGPLYGTAEDDVMFGHEGNDDLYGAGGNDVLYGQEDQDYLLGEAGNDILYGGDGGSSNFDILIGGDGNDILDGGLGTDDMRGDLGNDIFYVDNAGDGNNWLEYDFDGGFDEVRASVSYTLLVTGGRDDSIELLTLLEGAGAVNGTGNGIANTIVGNDSRNVLQGLSGDDTLEGGGGNDTLMGGLHNDWLDGGNGADDMYGGTGDDTYAVDDIGDVTSELQGSGHDTVRSSIPFTLAEGIEDMVLVAGAGAIDGTGNAGANTIVGNASDNEIRGEDGEDLLKGGGGADYLRGGDHDDELQGGSGNDQLRGDAGDDTMIGGIGNDAYLVDSHGDIVDEGLNAGIDTVTAVGLDYYTLPLDVENLNQSSGVYGTGNNLGNIITGNLFDNILDGAGGADTLQGRQGDDTYFVDNAADVVIEAGGQGVDEVRASASFTLGASADVETLRTTSDTGTAAINLTGNASTSRIVGNNGNNILNGGGGTDELIGRNGNDTYVVDSQSDTIIEAGGQGNDTVRTSVSYTLTAGADVETLETTLSTGTQAINLTGNNTGNTVRGNSGNNTLSGAGGNDSLTGLGGSDRFLFNSALDPVFNVDAITDFNVADDFILLDTAVFTALAPPDLFLRDLTAAEFRIGTAAQDATDRIIYNSATGDTLYDSDGVGGVAAIRFAAMAPGLALTNLDFLVV